jgi:hypothetical protein
MGFRRYIATVVDYSYNRNGNSKVTVNITVNSNPCIVKSGYEHHRHCQFILLNSKFNSNLSPLQLR